MKRCCICNHPIEGWGNNPWPVVKWEDARCCDYCNMKVVIPARLEASAESEDEDYGREQGEDV